MPFVDTVVDADAVVDGVVGHHVTPTTFSVTQGVRQAPTWAFRDVSSAASSCPRSNVWGHLSGEWLKRTAARLSTGNSQAHKRGTTSTNNTHDVHRMVGVLVGEP